MHKLTYKEISSLIENEDYKKAYNAVLQEASRKTDLAQELIDEKEKDTLLEDSDTLCYISQTLLSATKDKYLVEKNKAKKERVSLEKSLEIKISHLKKQTSYFIDFFAEIEGITEEKTGIVRLNKKIFERRMERLRNNRGNLEYLTEEIQNDLVEQAKYIDRLSSGIFNQFQDRKIKKGYICKYLTSQNKYTEKLSSAYNKLIKLQKEISTDLKHMEEIPRFAYHAIDSEEEIKNVLEKILTRHPQ